MKRTAFALAALALTGGAAHAADPTAVLSRTFTEYTGVGPIGNDNVQDNANFYWFYESTGTWMGQQVKSWFLFWDPRSSLSVDGSVTFDSNILFVHDTRTSLIATAAFGKVGVTYDYSDAAVGLESADQANTSFGGATLTLANTGWTASNPGDHIRVMTAVPEPGTYALLLAGLGVVALVSRRRKG
ncbi:MAG: PEP-CTERM sorting domain-containing protein [Aquabacterium sp.]